MRATIATEAKAIVGLIWGLGGTKRPQIQPALRVVEGPMRSRWYALMFKAAVALALCGCAPTGALVLGPLPPGAASYSQTGPSREIIVYVPFDPALLRDQVPAGLRLQTLKERAESDSELTSYLENHPERAGWASSFFEIIRSEWLEYDDVKARTNTAYAVWYAYVVRTDHSDPRPRGQQLLELGMWMADSRLVAHMRMRGYPVEAGDVQLSEKSEEIRGHLAAPGLRVTAEGRVYGVPRKAWWPEPGWQTVWSRTSASDHYEIITFRGHKLRDAQITWQISGNHLLALALTSGINAPVQLRSAEYAHDYVLLGGLYKRAP